ncbi:MAG: hypothetical protein QGG40_07220, partial [Myxococcota bacterium]|nr:hypothetical protein [Myxococcota bacterium]
NELGVQLVEDVVKEGLATTVDPDAGYNSTDNLFHNAAEWLDYGEADVVVLSPTHDSAERVGSGEVALFDPTSSWREEGADYDENDLGDTTQVEHESSTLLGSLSSDGETLTLVDPPSKHKDNLKETMIHEVQHDADQHGGVWGETPDDGRAPEWAYNLFLTEFRAYWYQSPEGSSEDQFGSSADTDVTNVEVVVRLSNGTTRSQATAFSNRRQQDIWMHLRGTDRPDGDWFDFTDSAWITNYAYLPFYYVLDYDFKIFVDETTQPTSGNAIGSVRIQALSECLGTTCGDADMETVQQVVKDLDMLDVNFLSDRDQSAPFWLQAETSLTPEQFIEFEAMMAVCE